MRLCLCPAMISCITVGHDNNSCGLFFKNTTILFVVSPKCCIMKHCFQFFSGRLKGQQRLLWYFWKRTFELIHKIIAGMVEVNCQAQGSTNTASSQFLRRFSLIVPDWSEVTAYLWRYSKSTKPLFTQGRTREIGCLPVNDCQGDRSEVMTNWHRGNETMHCSIEKMNVFNRIKEFHSIQ